MSTYATELKSECDRTLEHFKKDLTRIGTLAGFFIIILIVISFFLK